MAALEALSIALLRGMDLLRQAPLPLIVLFLVTGALSFAALVHSCLCNLRTAFL